MRRILRRTLPLLLAFSIVMTSSALADGFGSVENAELSRSSAYINNCSGRISPQGNGKFNIVFTVTGTGLMDQIGAMTIKIYKNGAFTDMFRYTYSGRGGMMGSNTTSWTDSERYQGVSGSSYSAVICFYAANSNGSDTIFYTTASVVV